jgi:ankyrin repeat protein
VTISLKQDADGENCLHKAARTGNAEIIEVLVDADKRLRKGREARGLVDGGNARDESCALKSACNNRGQTPLDLAEEVGGLADARIIQLLKD